MPGRPTLVVYAIVEGLFLMLYSIKTFVSVTFIATLIGFAPASLVCENTSDNRRKYLRTADEKLELGPYLIIK